MPHVSVVPIDTFSKAGRSFQCQQHHRQRLRLTKPGRTRCGRPQTDAGSTFIRKIVGEQVFQEWMDLDHLIVRLCKLPGGGRKYKTRNIALGFVTGDNGERDN